MEPLNEKELLTALNNGNRKALEYIFECYYRMLVFVAFRILHNHKDAEEIVQEMFVKFLEKKHYKKVRKSVGAYLVQTCRRECALFLRKRKAAENMHKGYQTIREEITSPEEKDLQAFPENVLNALLQLPAQRLMACKLVYVESRAYKEAAADMGISINTLKTHLKIALRDLRQQFNNAY